MNRRQFGALTVGIPLLAQRRPWSLKVGVMDGILKLPSDPKSVERAAAIGADGLQVTLGREQNGRLPLSDPALQTQFLAASKKHRIPLVATYIDQLHASCLKSDEAARRWVIDGLDITRQLDARILMLVFFGKCALTSPADIDAIVGPLKELAPEAKKANVILGFENTISAADNLRILDKVGSPMLQVYYDIGNATNMGGFTPAKEIRELGKRICQFHFKDKGLLGEGNVDVRAALDAIADIGFNGYAVLETSEVPRNLQYTRAAISETKK